MGFVMGATATFDRTLEQRRDALRKANRVRSERAALKSELASRRVLIGDVLADPPACVLSMPVFELVCALPRYGRARACKVLARIPVSATRPVGGMTGRERRRLSWLLRERS